MLKKQIQKQIFYRIDQQKKRISKILADIIIYVILNLKLIQYLCNSKSNYKLSFINPKSAENIIITKPVYQTMSQKGMKLTKILQNPNQHPQSNIKYQPLRKNIQLNAQKNTQIVQTDIAHISYVSKRFKSLSPEQAEIIKNTTFIPVNCKLKATQSIQKRQRATSQKYRAIQVQQSQKNDKPMSPNTFQKVIKNKKTEVVYQYKCPLSEQQNGSSEDFRYENNAQANNQNGYNGTIHTKVKTKTGNQVEYQSSKTQFNGQIGSNEFNKQVNTINQREQNNTIIQTNRNSRIQRGQLSLGKRQDSLQNIKKIASKQEDVISDGKISTLHQQTQLNYSSSQKKLANNININSNNSISQPIIQNKNHGSNGAFIQTNKSDKASLNGATIQANTKAPTTRTSRVQRGQLALGQKQDFSQNIKNNTQNNNVQLSTNGQISTLHEQTQLNTVSSQTKLNTHSNVNGNKVISQQIYKNSVQGQFGHQINQNNQTVINKESHPTNKINQNGLKGNINQSNTQSIVNKASRVERGELSLGERQDLSKNIKNSSHQDGSLNGGRISTIHQQNLLISSSSQGKLNQNINSHNIISQNIYQNSGQGQVDTSKINKNNQISVNGSSKQTNNNSRLVNNKNSRIERGQLALGNKQEALKSIHKNQRVVIGDGRISTLHEQNQLHSISSQGTFNPNAHSNKVISQHVYQNFVHNQGDRSNVSRNNQYTDHLTGGVSKASYHHYDYQYPTNQDHQQLDGPTFYQNQGRMRYNQIGGRSRQQYQLQYSRRIKQSSHHPQNITIGGRNKSSSKHTNAIGGQDFQSSIGINSRHNTKQNIGSTKDFSSRYNNNLSKQQLLEGQQTQVKGNIHNINYDNEVQFDDKSRVRDYVQNVQSRIVVGDNGRTLGDIQGGNNNISRNTNKKIETQRTIQSKQKLISSTSKKQLAALGNGQRQSTQSINDRNIIREEYREQEKPILNITSTTKTPAQIQQRNRKLKQYQQAGNPGYNFKKNEQVQAKRKKQKQQYKYNLFSMLDEQTNLKCATGFCTPNQVCASEPKKQGWK